MHPLCSIILLQKWVFYSLCELDIHTNKFSHISPNLEPELIRSWSINVMDSYHLSVRKGFEMSKQAEYVTLKLMVSIKYPSKVFFSRVRLIYSPFMLCIPCSCQLTLAKIFNWKCRTSEQKAVSFHFHFFLIYFCIYSSPLENCKDYIMRS